MPELGGERIINTVKGRQGKRAIYHPMGPDGKPLVPKEPLGVYDQNGKKKSAPLEGEVVDTEA